MCVCVATLVIIIVVVLSMRRDVRIVMILFVCIIRTMCGNSRTIMCSLVRAVIVVWVCLRVCVFVCGCVLVTRIRRILVITLWSMSVVLPVPSLLI